MPLNWILETANVQNQFRILNRFLIENLAVGDHLRMVPASVQFAGSLVGATHRRDIEETQGRSRGEVRARDDLLCPEVKMVLFSRSFVRKGLISLATAASIGGTSFAWAQDPPRTHLVNDAIPIQHVADRLPGSEEQLFLSENNTAMDKMTADMTIKRTGDVDRDFVAMMVPHHQGAADMANAELKYGHNEQLRRLAQEIVTSQEQEITAMRNALNEERSSATQSRQPLHMELSPKSAATDGSDSRGGMKMSQ
jgi:hypothetical protein